MNNKVDEQHLRARLRPYFLFEGAFAGISFIVPTLALHWQECGLTLAQIMQLEAIFAIVLACCEIPTGYVADRLGRKQSLTIASVLVFSGMCVYAFGGNFADFVVGECLLAIAVAFISGANDAFVMDTLHEFGQGARFMDIKGRALATHMTGGAVFAVIGGLIAARFGYGATFLPAIAVTALLLPAALMLKEPEREHHEFRRGYFREVVSIGRFALVDNKTLRWLILVNAVVLGGTHAAFWFYQPYFKLSGTPEQYYGWIYAGFSLFCALVTQRAGRWLANVPPATGIVFFVLLTVVGYLAAAQALVPWGFLFLLFHQSVRGLAQPFFSHFINHEVGGGIRATVGSISSMIRLLLYSAAIVPLGWCGESLGIPAAFIIAACGAAALSGLLLIAQPTRLAGRTTQRMPSVTGCTGGS